MSTESQPRQVRRYPRRVRTSQPGFGTVAVVAVVAAAGAAVVVRALGAGFAAWQAPHMIALVAGASLCAWGLFMFQRGLRQQARMRAIAELLPHYRERARHRRMADAAAAHIRRHSAANNWLDESEWADEATDAPLARSEVRAATRALLVSLEDEMRREATTRQERPAHPACRRARMRAAGRVKAERRRRVARARSSRTVS